LSAESSNITRAPSEAPKVAPANASGEFEGPKAQADLDLAAFGNELRVLKESRFFWFGVAAKIVAAFCFGSHFATRWFAPFVYSAVHGLSNPWAVFMAKGEPLAFPYGPAMLGILAPAWLPATFLSFDPSGHLGLFLLRLPLFIADLVVLILLMRWLRVYARDVVVAYWLSPIVFYATYVHGQLDLIPTALLCVSIFFMFKRRVVAAGITFGVALATKGHLLVAAPFLAVFLYRQRRSFLTFAAVAFGVAALLYAPCLSSPDFRAMVLHNAEARKLWAVVVPYGQPGPALYVAPAALTIAVLRFATYRKVNRELFLMFIGAVYVVLVTVVPPQPGWFIWSIPLVAYFGARFSKSGRGALMMVSGAYLFYFVISDPLVFFEAADPILGAGFGAAVVSYFEAHAPGLISSHAASAAWTILFSTTAIVAFEMYRKGVRSNSVYAFRDQAFMIGVGGDSGAGKHTIGRHLAALFEGSMTLINGDDDHRWERGHAKWREFTHLDPRGNRLSSQLESLADLRRGGNVRKRHYDHDLGRFTEPLLLPAKDYVSIIGLHPFYLSSQRALFHLRVFVDPKEEIRRAWKVSRDVAKRGYTPEQVIEQMDRRSEDSAKYIQPQKKHADVIVRQIEDVKGATQIAAEYELSNDLDPLALYEVFAQVEGVEVEWVPDESLTRDLLRVRGDLSVEQIRDLATVAIPNLDELVDEALPTLKEGGQGVTQLVLLHAISARLRGAHNEWLNT